MTRILLIDDDEALRHALKLMLVHGGHAVIEAQDGKDGLKRFAETEFDIVITDIVMPEIEGIAVLTALRKHVPPVKIIAMSGGGRIHAAEYLRMATFLGAAAVLQKPFTNEALMTAVDSLIPAPAV